MRYPGLLEELGDKYQPTKRAHDYLRHYWTHLRDKRLDVKTVVEIGVESDCSVRMWEEFFPNAVIHGVDIAPECKAFERGRVKIHIGDQGNREFLASVIEKVGGPVDLIIDDGSHKVEHQISTLNWLFPHLSDHGTYVIEDTGGLVGDEGLAVVNSLKQVIDHIYYWPKGLHGSEWSSLWTLPEGADWLSRNISGMAFYRWIVFLFRGRNPEDNPYLYRPSGPTGQG
jgi:hypothetical protein